MIRQGRIPAFAEGRGEEELQRPEFSPLSFEKRGSISSWGLGGGKKEKERASKNVLYRGRKHH